MKNDFKICPMCGSQKIECCGNRKWICPECGFDLYNNVAAAVGLVIFDDQFNVLFEERAKHPKKGFAALPGGFVDFDESAEEACVRECREELSVEICPKDLKFIASFPNTYVYKNIEYKTCDLFFYIKLPKKYNSLKDFMRDLKPEISEVSKLVCYRVSNEEDIAKIPLAFESAKKTLLKFVHLSFLGD